MDDLVDFLTAPAPPAAPSSPLELEVAPSPSLDAAGNKSLAVTVHNPSASSVSGTVLVRFLTWEEAMVQDAQQDITLAPQARRTVLIPFPAPGPTGYQALDFHDAFDARVGVLCADQTSLLAETHQKVDLDPPLTLSLQTDNLRAFTYPFPDAPDQDALSSFQRRMGMPVMAYAYEPGQTVAATVTLANGARNLASLAKVEDETQPENPTVSALTQENGQAEKGSRALWSLWRLDRQSRRGKRPEIYFSQPVWLSAVVLNGNSTNFRRYLTHNPGAVSIECDGKEIARDDHLDARFVSELGLARVAFTPVRDRSSAFTCLGLEIFRLRKCPARSHG